MATPVKRRDPAVQALPYPYKAWLALSSDPDNTLWPDWQELHRVIWKELGLPFADSFFIRSYNQHLKGQVDLHDHPEILAAHPHDTMHTWGDFMFGREKSFDRSDAEVYIAHLQRLGIKPRVWVDHSMFVGNMLHVHSYGSTPEFTDASGHRYSNPLYTLDLAHTAGVRYIWDGTITPVVGQDRPISLWRTHKERRASAKAALGNYLKHVAGERLGVGQSFRDQFPGNAAYCVRKFADGRSLYVFPRYGHWAKADIDGLGDLLAPDRMSELIREGGTCIAYTHLGKRPVDRMNAPTHVPANTVAALRGVKERFDQRELMVSSVSDLLDQLVLRDHIAVDVPRNTITFKADGIAFTTIDAAALAGRSFSFMSKGLDPEKLRVCGTSDDLQARVALHGPGSFTLHFGRQ